ncbi:hypothetical protein RJ641_004447, partial [Dillenia turbinata]
SLEIPGLSFLRDEVVVTLFLNLLRTDFSGINQHQRTKDPVERDRRVELSIHLFQIKKRDNKQEEKVSAVTFSLAAAFEGMAVAGFTVWLCHVGLFLLQSLESVRWFSDTQTGESSTIRSLAIFVDTQTADPQVVALVLLFVFAIMDI